MWESGGMGSSQTRAMRFDLPYQAEPPPLTGQGGTTLVARPATSHHIDVTVLDTPDDRLLRAGILLAHRVQDGVGTWYLAAPDWQPHLPTERVVPVDATADLPAEFTTLTRPFTRRAPVGPVANLDCERREYRMRDDGIEVGVIRDERVTLRRDGVVVARYREATITPQEGFTARHRDLVGAAMEQVEAVRVEEFPTLQQRLGPPATGGTDFPRPRRGRKREMTLESFVTCLFADDLRAVVVALLTDPESLQGVFAEIRGHARGLASVLDPGWLHSLEQLLLPSGSPGSRALDVIDALVGAVRAPRLGDASREPAARLLLRRAERGARILSERCGCLTPQSPDREWEAARAAAEQLHASGAVAVQLQGKAGRRVMGHLTDVARALDRCVAVTIAGPLEGMSVEEAFELGRQVERTSRRAAIEREVFVEQWPQHVTTVTRLLAKARR